MNNKEFIVFIFILFLFGIFTWKPNDTYKNNNTNMNDSVYNTMSPSDYHSEMKSENLQYADVAWHAQNTYGWNCSEIVNIGEAIQTSGRELKDSYLISQIKGNYSIATCSSGLKLRIYPRYNTYPIITNINGGFE